MLPTLGTVSLLFGAACAHAATLLPAHVKLLELGGGALLVAGLALLGSALSCFV
jgi:hypothetical protein